MGGMLLMPGATIRQPLRVLVVGYLAAVQGVLFAITGVATETVGFTLLGVWVMVIAFRLLWPRIEINGDQIRIRNVRSIVIARDDVIHVGESHIQIGPVKQYRAVVDTRLKKHPVWAVDHMTGGFLTRSKARFEQEVRYLRCLIQK